MQPTQFLNNMCSLICFNAWNPRNNTVCRINIKTSLLRRLLAQSRVQRPCICTPMRGGVGDNTIMTYTDPSHRGEIVAISFLHMDVKNILVIQGFPQTYLKSLIFVRLILVNFGYSRFSSNIFKITYFFTVNSMKLKFSILAEFLLVFKD